jgi:hypothetical protein
VQVESVKQPCRTEAAAQKPELIVTISTPVKIMGVATSSGYAVGTTRRRPHSKPEPVESVSLEQHHEDQTTDTPE